MVIAVLADIHSNLDALEAVLADAERMEAQLYIVAGDLISDGPSPCEVLQRVRKLTPHVVMGNREDYMLRYRNGELAAWDGLRQVASILWTYHQLQPDDLDYIANLPEQIAVPLDAQMSIRVVHGSPLSMYELLKPKVDMAPVERAARAVQEQVLVFGHNHLQWSGEVCGKLLINPGAVGVPFNGNTGAEYGILRYENGIMSAELRRVPYDLSVLERRLNSTALVIAAPEWTKLTFEGVKDGRNYCIEFLNEARQTMIKRGIPTGMVPNDIWDETARVWWARMGWGHFN